MSVGRVTAVDGAVVGVEFPGEEPDLPSIGHVLELQRAGREPDEKVVPLVMLAEAARDLGAQRVGLVAPYLSYMRQDKRFHTGEGITSVYFWAVLVPSRGLARHG